MKHRLVHLAVLLAILLPSSAFAQATVASSPTVTNIPRAGIDLGGASYFTAQTQGNYFQNPGFEWLQLSQVIGINTVSGSTSFTSLNTVGSGAEPSNFWTGSNICSVRVGTCSDGTNNYCWNNASTVAGGGCSSSGTCNAGTVFGLSAYNSTGGTQTFTCSGSCPTLVAPALDTIGSGGHVADVVGCRVVVTNPTNWTNIGNWPNWSSGWGLGAGSFTNTFVTAAQAYQGNSSLEINAASATQTINYLWDNGNAPTPSVCVSHPLDICAVNSDCPGGDTCNNAGSTAGPFVNHPITGSGWTFSFYATSATGATCTATLARSGGAGNMLNQSFTITAGTLGTWNPYSTTFSGNDTSSTLGQLNFNFSCSGGLLYLDNIYMGRPATDVSGFTADTVTALKALNPGSIRQSPTDVSGGAATAAQVDGASVNMPPMGQIESTGFDSTAFSYGDMVGLAAAVSPQTAPWLTVGMAWPDSDYTAFGTQLCSWENTYAFPTMYVECNNEDWNSGEGGYFKLGNGYFAGYGLACARAQLEIKNAYDVSCSSTDSDVHYFINNQTGNSGVMYSAQGNYNWPNTSQYGYDDNFYINAGSNSTVLATVIAAQFPAVTSLVAAVAPGNNFNDAATGCQGAFASGPGCNQIIQWYEGGPQAEGTGNNIASSYANVGWAGAGIELNTLLQLLATPVANLAGDVTNTFQLSQSGANGIDQWGITPGNWGLSSAFAPVYPWFRPAGLAIELYNQAIGTNPSYYPCTSAPSGITCVAFKSGSNWTAVLSSANATPNSSMTITFPTGTVPTSAKSVNFINGQSDNNEATNTVTIGNLSGGISYSGQTGTFTMPAYGAVALLQGGSSSPASGAASIAGHGASM